MKRPRHVRLLCGTTLVVMIAWHLARGLYVVLPPDLLSVFDAYELELLLCGAEDVVDDWEKHTEYAGEYRRRGSNHPVVMVRRVWRWSPRTARLPRPCRKCRVPSFGFRLYNGTTGASSGSACSRYRGRRALPRGAQPIGWTCRVPLYAAPAAGLRWSGHGGYVGFTGTREGPHRPCVYHNTAHLPAARSQQSKTGQCT